LVIGCDPKTNTATINLYVRDDIYKGNVVVENPKLGRCFAGDGDNIHRAVKVTQTFECNAPQAECSATQDNCVGNTYCNFSEINGYSCKEYVPVGSSCGGYTIPGEDSQCNPSEAFCFYPRECELPDLAGICVSYEGDCTSDEDCGGLYCSFDGKCKPKINDGICCNPDERNNQCFEGSVCREPIGESEAGEWGFKCRSTGGGVDGLLCSPRCSDNERCVKSGVDRTYSCEPYLAVGKACGKSSFICNPAESFCQIGDSCYKLDNQGKCVAFTSDEVCSTNDDCTGKDEYCDSTTKRCHPSAHKGFCCLSDDECGVGLTCQPQLISDLFITKSFCHTACSGNDAIECANDEWCTLGQARNGQRFCKPFARKGEMCEFFAKDPFFEICDPNKHYCRITNSCIAPDRGGTCEPLGKPCSSASACDRDQWCDLALAHCKPKYVEGSCCDPDVANQCIGDLICSSGSEEFGPLTCHNPLARGVNV